MRRRLDDLFSALMLAAGVAVVLVGYYCLSRSIARAGEAVPIPVAPICIGLPAPESEPSEATQLYIYDPAIPLSAELQAVFYEACEENGVPVALALGVIEVESCFQVDAVSSEGCYGLMQLNPKYFPDKLSPEDNLRAGIEYLGRLLEQYGDPAAALTAYNTGYDTGRRAYANAVLAAAEWWEEAL